MAYVSDKLSLIVSTIEGQGPNLWNYPTSDSLATVLGAGYISDATKKNLRIGDIVLVSTGTFNTAVYPASGASTADVGEAADFTAAPSAEWFMVDSITTGAATLKALRAETIVDSSGGTANSATGVVANLTKQLVTIPVQLLDLATGTLKVALPYAFTVVGTPQFRVAKPATTAAKAATATLQVSGVAATGGVISLTSANCTPMGAAVAASAAVTAGGTGAAGGTVEFALSSVTAFVEGDGYFEVTVTNNDLANAIATLIKF